MLDCNTTAIELNFVKPLTFVDSKMAISVVGLGYVGAVSTACLSSLGHEVIGVDIDPKKIALIGSGKSPIFEKNLGELLAQGVEAGRISATNDLAEAVRRTEVTFVSVGTPTASDGGCDHRYIQTAARKMAEGLADKSEFHVFVMRCSIPPGTTMQVMTPILEQVSGKTLGEDFGVCFNPEFLREGVAVEDFRSPPKTVIGASDQRSAKIVAKLFAPIDRAPIFTTVETAEMVKYVDNVWHAAKVCFANEIGRLCKPLDIDSHAVMDVFVQDTKLNLSPYYLKPGFAFGGSCLPKEVRAVAHIAESIGADLPMIRSLGQSNATHIQKALDMVRQTEAKTVGVLGLAFKAGTDDLRESPILEVIAALHADGVAVKIHDPAITKCTDLAGQLAFLRQGFPGLEALASDLSEMLCDSPDDVADAADTLVITQKNRTYQKVATEVQNTRVIDLVRLFADVPTSENYDGIGW